MRNHERINTILVSMFNSILDIEENCICKGEFSDLSVTEMHVIEAVGLAKKPTMTLIAKELRITSGTLTTTVNNLIKKGYLSRIRSEEDRRVVFVELSEKGKQAYSYHEEFHRELVRSAILGLDENQQLSIIELLLKIDKHFKSKL